MMCGLEESIASLQHFSLQIHLAHVTNNNSHKFESSYVEEDIWKRPQINGQLVGKADFQEPVMKLAKIQVQGSTSKHIYKVEILFASITDLVNYAQSTSTTDDFFVSFDVYFKE